MDKKDVAQKVMGNLEVKSDAPQFSPLIMEIIIQVVAFLIQKCGESLINNSKKQPGLFQMMAMRRAVKTAFRQSGKGVVEFREHGEDVINAILKTGKGATEEDIRKAIEAFGV